MLEHWRREGKAIEPKDWAKQFWIDEDGISMIKPKNRETGCKHCKAKGPMEGEPITDPISAIELMVDGVFLYVWCECGTHIVKEIKYCPMCGRKLE